MWDMPRFVFLRKNIANRLVCYWCSFSAENVPSWTLCRALECNHLTGPIPSTFSSLTNLIKTSVSVSLPILLVCFISVTISMVTVMMSVLRLMFIYTLSVLLRKNGWVWVSMDLQLNELLGSIPSLICWSKSLQYLYVPHRNLLYGAYCIHSSLKTYSWENMLKTGKMHRVVERGNISIVHKWRNVCSPLAIYMFKGNYLTGSNLSADTCQLTQLA